MYFPPRRSPVPSAFSVSAPAYTPSYVSEGGGAGGSSVGGSAAGSPIGGAGGGATGGAGDGASGGAMAAGVAADSSASADSASGLSLSALTSRLQLSERDDASGWARYSSAAPPLAPAAPAPAALTLFVFVGLPGAGKSTAASRIASGALGPPARWCIVNQDSLGSRVRCEEAALAAFARGCHVVVDRCACATALHRPRVRALSSGRDLTLLFPP
jgi:hypothetical protein